MILLPEQICYRKGEYVENERVRKEEDRQSVKGWWKPYRRIRIKESLFPE